MHISSFEEVCWLLLWQNGGISPPLPKNVDISNQQQGQRGSISNFIPHSALRFSFFILMCKTIHTISLFHFNLKKWDKESWTIRCNIHPCQVIFAKHFLQRDSSTNPPLVSLCSKGEYLRQSWAQEKRYLIIKTETLLGYLCCNEDHVAKCEKLMEMECTNYLVYQMEPTPIKEWTKHSISSNLPLIQVPYVLPRFAVTASTHHKNGIELHVTKSEPCNYCLPRGKTHFP